MTELIVTFRLELILNGPTGMFSVWVTYLSQWAHSFHFSVCVFCK